MPIDPGLVALKKSGLICPFVTTPEQYGLEARRKSLFSAGLKRKT